MLAELALRTGSMFAIHFLCIPAEETVCLTDLAVKSPVAAMKQPKPHPPGRMLVTCLTNAASACNL